MQAEFSLRSAVSTLAVAPRVIAVPCSASSSSSSMRRLLDHKAPVHVCFLRWFKARVTDFTVNQRSQNRRWYDFQVEVPLAPARLRDERLSMRVSKSYWDNETTDAAVSLPPS